MGHSFIRGASSLLFILSTAKAYSSSNLLFWKIGNTILIPASYLCNAYNYEPTLMLLDYMAIFTTGLGYINNIYFSGISSAFMLCEYKYNKTIETTKNTVFILSSSLAIYNTHKHSEKNKFYIILASAFSGITMYKMRYVLNKQKNTKYNTLLTMGFHICATATLYISSITARQ